MYILCQSDYTGRTVLKNESALQSSSICNQYHRSKYVKIKHLYLGTRYHFGIGSKWDQAYDGKSTFLIDLLWIQPLFRRRNVYILKAVSLQPIYLLNSCHYSGISMYYY